MKCGICNKEVKKYKVVNRWTHNGREEVLQGSTIFCRDCYLAEWNCRAFRYSSKEECAYYFDKFASDDIDIKR